jgi:hypothetical protein
MSGVKLSHLFQQLKISFARHSGRVKVGFDMRNGHFSRAGFNDHRTPDSWFGHHDVVAALASYLKPIEFEQLD